MPGGTTAKDTIADLYRPLAVLVAMVALATACATAPEGGREGGTSVTTSVTAPQADADRNTAQVMAAAFTELVTNDNTFTRGEPPFSLYLVQSSIDPYAGKAELDPTVSVRPLTEGERSAIEAALAAFGPVQWIADPDEWRTDDLRPKIDGSVILGIGEPVFDAQGALVPVSLWCGSTCGIWLTYRLVQTDQGWQVTGVDGPMSIS